MKFKLLWLALFVSTLLFTSCKEDTTEEVSKTYDLQGFTEIDLGDAFEIIISKGNTFEVKAFGTTRNIDELQLKVVNNRLTAKYEPYRNARKRTQITVQVPKLTYLRLSGATETELRGFFSATDSLKLSVDGASELDADMEWRYLDLKVSGASDVTLDGVTRNVKMEVSGTSRLIANNLRTETVEANVSGVSRASVNVLKSLTGNVSGNSELRYIGNPTTLQVELSGNSKLTKL
ncbi:MAG: head GIN domain-containing protein [Saprospiraceae bacterium]